MSKWSVVTVTYNSADTLREFWSDQVIPPHVEWIVVDNASDDDSASVAAELGARVIPNESNLGFGRANNVGFAASNSEYVLFANPDMAISFADLDRLGVALESFPRALVSPQLIHPDGTAQPNGRGAPLLYFKILNRIAPERVHGRYTMAPDGDETLEVDWLMGASVAGKRDWLDVLGPWDPKFFVYYEDSDLGIRNSLAGGKSLVLGSVRWVHGWARETKSFKLRAWKLEISSMARFYSRYPQLLNPLAARTRERSTVVL